jgi:hypothetical protein
VRKGFLIPLFYALGVSFIGRKKKEFVTMHDDVGLGSASESVRFLYRGKLILYSLKKSICKE